jgi:hypothetical protein
VGKALCILWTGGWAGPNELALATCRRGFPGTAYRISRVAARWPVQTAKLPVRGLSADRTNSCIVLLILNGGSRDERSDYTLGVLPKERNPITHHIAGWMGPRAGVDVLEKIKISFAATDI